MHRYELMSYGEDPDGYPTGAFLTHTGPWARANPEAAHAFLTAFEAAYPETWMTWALRTELGLPTD